MKMKKMDGISSGSVSDGFPPLCSKFPWLVAQNLQDEEEQNNQDLFFYTIHNPLPHYRCRIPELLGERIRGCFHGWVILSNHPNNNKWSLWNQETSEIIRLPTLVLEDGGYESIGECCLSAPPEDPSSILLLARTDKPTFVFFRLVSKRNKSRWTEMSYAYQLKRLTSNGKLVHSLTCCNGKVYALSTDGSFDILIIHVDIMIKDKEVLIKLMLFGGCPSPPLEYGGLDNIQYLKGSSTELFYILIYLEKEIMKAHKMPFCMFLYKSDMTCINWEERECLKNWDLTGLKLEDVPEKYFKDLDKCDETWEEIDDLKDAIFFLDLARDHSVSFRRVTASDLGGYVYIRGGMGESIYSYHVKNDTISVFPIPSPVLPTSHLSMWECRLEDEHGEAKCVTDSKVEMENKDEVLLRSGMDDKIENKELCLLNIPFHILETIIEHCVGVEYLNFRATCKQCHLAAPLIKWSDETSIRRLQWYSFISPWLMVVDRKQGMITFTDPLSGDNYFMKNPTLQIVGGKLLRIVNGQLYCSRFGWLLCMSKSLNCLLFYNPFTNAIRDNIPDMDHKLRSFCFSAPPTSLDCLVVGFTTLGGFWRADIVFVNKETTWRILNLGQDPHTVCFSTFYGGDLYTLCKKGELIVFNNLGKEDYSSEVVEAEAPKGGCTSSVQYFLTSCEQHLLLVSVGKYGGHVEVFKRTESKQGWEKIDSVGKYMIFICGATCLCIEAKVPFMENKIFFPRLHTKSRKAVFYSLDTCKYYTFDGENVQEHLGDLFGTTYNVSPNAWIEPTWS